MSSNTNPTRAWLARREGANAPAIDATVRDLVQARIPADLALALRIAAATEGRRIQDIVADAISEWLTKNDY